MTTIESDLLARNVAAACRVLTEIFPADDEAALIEVTSPEFVNHEAPAATPPGPGGAIHFMHLLARAFSDQRWEIEKTVAQGDLVTIVCTHQGRHTGEFFGIAPTGKTFKYRQMHLIRMVDGRSAEHWAVRDDASLMRQLGAVIG